MMTPLSQNRTKRARLCCVWLWIAAWGLFFAPGAWALPRAKTGLNDKSGRPARVLPLLVKDTIVVKFKAEVSQSAIQALGEARPSGFSSLDNLRKTYNLKRIWKQFRGSKRPRDPSQVDLSRIYKLRFPPTFDPQGVAEAFSLNPLVQQAQVIMIHPVYATLPNDPFFSDQWALSQIRDHDVDAPEAWSLSRGSSDVVLAVADTGVDWQHPDIGGSGPDFVDGAIWINWAEYNGTPGVDDDGNGFVDDIRGWDWVDGVQAVTGEDKKDPDNDPMDFNGHGTHVAGIVNAVTDNDAGVAGLGWGSKIMPLRIGWSGRSGGSEVGYIRMDFAAEAFYYAANMGATAINCSWGSSDSGGLAEAADYAVSKDVLIVVAAGNENTSQPSDYLLARADTVKVASTNPFDVKSSFSNFGGWVSVSAPGSKILSTYFDHNAGNPHAYAYLDGTSMAAPQMVGLIGLLKAFDPSLTGSQITTHIQTAADPIDSRNPSFAGQLGTGRINASNALHQLANKAEGTGRVRAAPSAVGTERTVLVRFTLEAEVTVSITRWELTLPESWTLQSSPADIAGTLSGGCAGGALTVSSPTLLLTGIDITKDGANPSGAFTLELTAPQTHGASIFASRTAGSGAALSPIEPLEEARVLVSPVKTPPWSDDLEDGGSAALGEWFAEIVNGTGWELGSPVRINAGPASAKSGANAWGTDLNDDYQDFSEATLITPFLDLTQAGSPARITFFHYLDAEETTSPWDGGLIEVSTDGVTWTQIPAGALSPTYDKTISSDWDNPLGGRPAYTHDTGGWVEVTGNLDAYLGQIIQVSFHFGTDSYPDTSDGWFIDDIQVTASTAGPVLSVSILEDEIDFLTLPASATSVFGVPVTVRNQGSVSTTYSLQISEPERWRHSTDFVDHDVYILEAAFANQAESIDWDYLDHSLSTAPAAATETRFGNNVEEESGMNVPTSEDRSLWYRMGMPLSSSTTGQQVIQVTITAEQ